MKKLKGTCQNCGQHWDAGQLYHQWPDLPGWNKRLDPGDIVPLGECNWCGAAVVPREEESAERP